MKTMKKQEVINKLLTWYFVNKSNFETSVAPETKAYYDGKMVVLNNVLYELYNIDSLEYTFNIPEQTAYKV